MLNRAGAAGPTTTGKLCEAPPAVIATEAVPETVASGTTKLICPGAAYSRDELRRVPVESVTTRLAPPSETGSGIVMACSAAVARF
jgi:hypothetical protein